MNRGSGRPEARLVRRALGGGCSSTWFQVRDSGGSGLARLQQQQRQRQQHQQRDDSRPVIPATATATTEGPEATARATNHDGPARGDPDSLLGTRRDANANPFAISEPGPGPAGYDVLESLTTLDNFTR